jgi:hypothetical protein
MAINGMTDNVQLQPENELKAPSPPPVDLGTLVVPMFPDPTTSPAAFLDHLKFLGVSDLVTAWEHLTRPPVRLTSTNRYDEDSICSWTDRMDILVVSNVIHLLISTSH